ncbi:DNA-binding protein [Coniochaeta sp. 2T2.1]|nr:DNA-binding protein [Coniochaeta sp. 2T2.1]
MSEPAEIPLSQAHTLLTTFSTFLTISLHNILYYRSLYPRTTFLSSRAYNLPVHQNRHPKVCEWITSAISAVSAQLALGTVSRVAIVIHAPLHINNGATQHGRFKGVPAGAVLERYVFDVSRFPSWPGGPDAMRDYGNSLRRQDEEEDDVGRGSRFAPAAPDEEDDEQAERERERETKKKREGKINWTDVDEQFRGVLRRMASAAEKMEPLPEGCSFTVAVELRDESRAPIGHPQPWIPTKPNLQPPDGSDLGGAKTIPVRSVEAGPLFFECWVEEGKAKDTLKDGMHTQQTQQSSIS